MSDIQRDRRYALLIGAMKSGTSSLYRYLIQHPQICACRVKEPEYFSQNQRHGIEVTEYSQLWEFSEGQHVYCLEASTGYSKYPEEPCVPQAIYQYGLEPRFLYIVRDPVERLESDYNYMRQHPELSEGDSPLTRERVYRSMYYTQLSRYTKYFPDRSRYYIVRLKELAAYPGRIVGEISDFLGLDDFGQIEFERHNTTDDVARAEQWFRRPGLYWVRKLVPKAARRSLRRFLRQVSGSAYRKLTPSERSALRDRLDKDMQRLRNRFGVNVTEWGF